eukprot:CAMPEP_0201509924 /NCGR_PEP_ID=MMETSP0161_2-20130828/2818_1 /ASSEMBLY_ACC=CAM_ASM_000251 /TAXON_ID=180227 /ORGANISM="Neoparamoeba aestuarina, Strain SoJaBio B1-5/56/2" /LENGTH=213 /DNA_ID=CAMNT_0047905017 /DNA_START=148 /DNA_END=786 /DNA_ORIENTATION=+
MVSIFTEQGQQRLLQKETLKQDFFYLSSQFLTQRTNKYCGVASSVIVLNALPVPAPVDNIHGYPFFNQNNYFTQSLEEKAGISPYNFNGLDLEQLSDGLEAHGCRTEVVYAQGDVEEETSKFRDTLIKNLDDPTNFVLVNYYRPGINEVGGGHISPVAAYHFETDSMLLMDVARYKYEPAWVSVPKFYNAMTNIDSGANKPRGYLEVWASMGG